MSVSIVFRSLAVIFILLSAYFAYSYFTSDRAEEDVTKLILTMSNLILAAAMFLLSLNKAFKKQKNNDA